MLEVNVEGCLWIAVCRTLSKLALPIFVYHLFTPKRFVAFLNDLLGSNHLLSMNMIHDDSVCQCSPDSQSLVSRECMITH